MDQLIITGRLGSDPEMKYLPNDTAVTNFSVAANRVWKDAQGEKVEQVVWYRIAAWGKQAESCNQYLSKGSQATCIPRARQRFTNQSNISR